MKRILKATLALTLAVIFCGVFAGCDMIDEMRENHAIISEDKNAVVYQGKTFLRLPEGIPYYFNDTDSNIINVTDYDVPVLLSEEFCYTGYYDPLNGIVAVLGIDEQRSNDSSSLSDAFTAGISPVYSYTPAGIAFFTQKENYAKYAELTAEDADRIGFHNINSDFGTTLFSSSAGEEILNLTKGSGSWGSEEIKDVTGNIYPLYKCNKELTLRGALDSFEIYITEDNQVYLSNYNTGRNVKLSEKSAEDIIEKHNTY